MQTTTNNFCTVGDHTFSGKENVVPFGRFQGHSCCAQCYVAVYSEALADRAKQKAASSEDLKRKKAARDREKREGLDVPGVDVSDLVAKDEKEAPKAPPEKPKSPKGIKPKSAFYYTLIKTFCPGCHGKWEACKSPVEHKAKFVTPYIQAG